MANSWQGKMCPVLSSGVVRIPEEQRVIAGVNTPPKRQADMDCLPCQGPACAWFMHTADEQGRPTDDGACAVLFAVKGVGDIAMLAQGVAVAVASASQPPAAPGGTNGSVIPNKPR